MRRALGMQQKVGSMTAVLSENLSAYREVRAFNLELREEERLKQSSAEFLQARMKVVKYAHLLTPLIRNSYCCGDFICNISGGTILDQAGCGGASYYRPLYCL